MPKPEKQKIVWAGDLPLCEVCEEPWCPTCEAHYAECACPVPALNVNTVGRSLTIAPALSGIDE